VRIKVLGKYWSLTFPPYLGDNHGDCAEPKAVGKRIRIWAGLSGRELTDVLIHEMLHASGWHLTEEFVTEFAHDVARVLHHPDIQRRIHGEK
jgi:hypothetical protein